MLPAGTTFKKNEYGVWVLVSQEKEYPLVQHVFNLEREFKSGKTIDQIRSEQNVFVAEGFYKHGINELPYFVILNDEPVFVGWKYQD